MKNEEDEAFDELAKRQGAWGGGFTAKRKMAADKLQDGKCKYCVDGCIACDARAQPAQEPVAWVWKDMRGQDIVSLFEPRFNSVPLYTAPPQRPWVGLLDTDIGDEFVRFQIKGGFTQFEYAVRAIEAKLKEKNG